MENETITDIMIRETARALPWGVMLLVVIAISGTWIKQEVKEAIEFTAGTAVHQAQQVLLDTPTFVRIKQNAKEAIQYATHNAANEYIRAQQQLQQGQ